MGTLTAFASARHILHVFPSFGIGGVPIRMARIINHLGPRFRHTIVVLDANAAARDRLRPDVTADLVLHHSKRHLLSTIINAQLTFRQQKPDLLVTYNWGAIEWALSNRLLSVTPHIHHEAGFSSAESDRQFLRRILLRRFALARARKVVVPSRTLVEIASKTWSIPEDRLLYIPNGIDVGRFAENRGNDNSSFFARTEDEVVIGTIAPLRPEKNLARLLRVFGRVRSRSKARLVIGGDGSERGSLESHAQSLGLGERVVFLGNITRPELLLRKFDLFAVSSDTEQMPNSVLEAMATGLPIVGVDVGDIRHMVAPENVAFLVHKHDEDTFATKILELVDAADQRRRLGELNRDNVVRRFSQEDMFAAYERVFSK